MGIAINNNVTSISNLVSWINEHKSSPFGDFRFVYTQGDGLCIREDETTSSSICIIDRNITNAWIVWIGNQIKEQQNLILTSATTAAEFTITKAIICSGGILFEVYGKNGQHSGSASTYYRSFDLGLTIDKNGRPCIIYRWYKQASYARLPLTANVTNWKILGVGFTSTDVPVTIKPIFNSNKTTLAPVVPDSSDVDNYLPYCYMATATQLPNEGLTAVRINGVDYITNGIFYIRDTPLE